MQESVSQAQKILGDDLKRLQELADFGRELTVTWVPSPKEKYEGEVRDGTILIYSGTLEEARRTLKHEFIDYVVSQAAEPYRDICNLQRTALNAIFKHLEEQAYKRKEQAVRALERLNA